ncbi:Uncharacterised protein [Edwardsiella tarda]|uniref:Uncharacterized protein n=1 Tax=Edwardsiella tarda ATCC 15947 = NBRC 105688 TaxID=667121 RepID=A0AC61TMT0_EDWTA|nr:hypothetical protein [Edwardsiella tarda]UCQ02030.1 hypothetical protein DCL27_17130 [Edwardsiella tarda ATCC 15947 = NBRC 105688]STE53107.1 Uncharacterised protein [Edwardsiella tarda]
MHRRKRILLIGNCEYELLGLSHLLVCMGYAVVRRPNVSLGRKGYDLTLVALSAELLAGWGRHLQRVRKLYAANPVPMVLLVPSRLKGMTLLRGTAQVINGRYNLSKLRTMLQQAFKGASDPEPAGELTCHQKKALMSLRMAINCNASQEVTPHKDYYLRSRLVEHVGVKNLHVLCVSGLLSEVNCWQE